MQELGAEGKGLANRAGVSSTDKKPTVEFDHEPAQQYWMQAEGTGRTWLAVEYAYTRAPSSPAPR